MVSRSQWLVFGRVNKIEIDCLSRLSIGHGKGLWSRNMNI